MAEANIETPQEKAFFESGGKSEVKQTDLLDLPLKEPDEKAPEKEQVPVEVKMVPHEAMHQERERRKKAERETQQERENRAKLEGRLGMLEQLAKQQPQTPAVPEFEKDPLTNLNVRTGDVAKQVETVLQNQQQINQHQQMQAAHQQFIQTYRMKAAEFTRDKPDFPAAYNHVQETLARDFQLVGFPPEQVSNMVAQYEQAIVAKALQDGRNPAETIYSLAEGRGYKAKSEAANDKLDTIAKGMENSRTLSGASKTAPAKTRLEALANMTDEEFDDATKGNKWKRLFE